MTAALSSDPTLADVIFMLWRSRRSLLAGLDARLCAGALFLMLAVPHYRVTLLVGPAGAPVHAAEQPGADGTLDIP